MQRVGEPAWTAASQHKLVLSPPQPDGVRAGFVFTGPGCLFAGGPTLSTDALNFTATLDDVVTVMLSWTPSPVLVSQASSGTPAPPGVEDVTTSNVTCGVVAMATGDVRVSLNLTALLGSARCGNSTTPMSVMLLAGVYVHL
jgi:hypothetical protein